jgi:hypothetical protein
MALIEFDLYANVVGEPGPFNSTSLDMEVESIPGTSAGTTSIELQSEAEVEEENQGES